MKTVIIGGVAGGLSAASQIKREDPGAEVIVLEKSGDVSYGACGMLYNLFFKDKPAGGELGVDGAIKVDCYLRTNLPGVFAAGDCAEHYIRQLDRNGYMRPVANKQAGWSAAISSTTTP